MNADMNFCWFFFRNDLPSDLIVRLIAHIEECLKVILRECKMSTQECFFALYSQEYKDPVCHEHGIWIQKRLGAHRFTVPVIRIFFGQNNILSVLQLPGSVEFPSIGDFLLQNNFISIFHTSILTLLTTEWDWRKYTHFVDLTGNHCCRLNCGGCCDGDDYTRSLLLGGQYCRGLSTVGQLCLYRLFDPPLPLENLVCEAYRCGQLQDPISDNVLPSCKNIYCFIPHYDGADMAEFFDQLQRIAEKVASEEILEMTVRAQEIRHYMGIVYIIQQIIDPYRPILPKFTEAFLFALARNHIDNCVELLNQNREVLLDCYNSLQIALEGFRAWYSRYTYRRHHQAPRIFPEVSFESNVNQDFTSSESS